MMLCTASFSADIKSTKIQQPIVKNPTYSIRYPNQVNLLLNQINPQEMWKNLTVLTKFPDRSSFSNSGIEAANWIKSQIEKMILDSGRKDAIVYTVETNGLDGGGNQESSKQPSVILKIGALPEAGVVIGAHFDTQGCWDDEGCVKDPSGPYPGADDDGSGTVAVLETARTLLFSNITFKKPIYLIWYAAEEDGEVGSQSVVKDFIDKKIPIAAVMQLDQIGYAYQNDSTMWLPTIGGRENADLTNYLKLLIETYIKQPVKFGCNGESDDFTWSKNGFNVSRPLETDYCDLSHFYPYVHSNQDTIDKISLTHMTDYLKLAVAFTVELAGEVLSAPPKYIGNN